MHFLSPVGNEHQIGKMLSSLYHVTSMDFTTPWKPSINGNEVPPCRLYEDVVEEGARPSSQRDPGWTLKTLEPIFVRAPKAKFALWECALAIWRLRLSEEEGGKEVVWQEHVQAWLVRRQDV